MPVAELRAASRCCWLGLIGWLAACSSSGTIKGTVTVTGAADNSAIVAIPGQSLEVGAGGTFTFSSVPAGSVTVFASRDGYSPASQTVTVSGGKDATVALTLNPAPVAPEILGITAVPAVVAPGGTVALSAAAKAVDGYPLNYTWAVPSSWTASGPTNQSSLALVAPSTLGQSDLVVLTVDDGHGASASSSVVVATTSDMALTPAIIATPTNPYVGVAVDLTAQVSEAGTSPLSYKWSLAAMPIGSSATLPSASESTATFTPDVAGNYVVRLVVTDADGGSSPPVSATIAVVSGGSTAPAVKSISVTPTSPAVGTNVSLSASVLAPDELVTYAWSLAQVPAGSAATVGSASSPVANFTPDVAGNYLVQLVVTDTNGLASPAATTWIFASNAPPVAAIGGSPLLSGVVNTPLVLDGSQSAGAPGHSLSYSWSVTGWPTGSHCGGTICLAAQGSGVQTKLTPDVAGSYTVVLNVTDTFENQTSATSTKVQVIGPAQIVILSGNNQSGTVHQVLLEPVIIEVLASDGVTPVPGVGLTWLPANATLKQSSSTTAANGTASAVIQLGRVAGTGSVRVFTSGNPTITQVIGISPQPDQAASYALALGLGNADTGIPFSVQIVDQFGNPATTTTAALSGTLNLTLQSVSGQASFGTPTTGALDVTGMTPPQATITLSNGRFETIINDTVAETLQVQATHGPMGLQLPISVWNSTLFDGAEAGLNKWNATASNSLLGSWMTENMEAKDGLSAFQLNFSVADEYASQEADLTALAAIPNPGFMGTVLLSFQSNVQVSPVFDTIANCSSQPMFRVRMANNSMGSNGQSVTPVGAYEITDNCSNALASFGATNNVWTTETVDVTDAIVGGTGYVNFQATTGPDTNAAPTQPSSWTIDDIWVRSLTAPNSGTVTASVAIPPGVPTTYAFRPTQAVIFGQCVSGQSAPYNVSVQLVDAHGNVVPQTQPVEVDWTGATGTINVMMQTGFLSSVLPNGIQLQVNQGVGQFQLTDTAPDTLTFTINPLQTGYAAGSSVTQTAVTYHCHNNGAGQNWSDGTPGGTYNAAEALNACQAFYGVGNCAVNGSYAYDSASTGGACYANTTIWSFNSWTPTTGACASSTSFQVNAGTASSLYEYQPSSCSCAPATGQTSNVRVSGGAAWN